MWICLKISKLPAFAFCKSFVKFAAHMFASFPQCPRHTSENKAAVWRQNTQCIDKEVLFHFLQSDLSGYKSLYFLTACSITHDALHPYICSSKQLLQKKDIQYILIFIYIIYTCFFMHLDVFVMGKISFKKTQPSGNKSQVRFNIRSLPNK